MARVPNITSSTPSSISSGAVSASGGPSPSASRNTRCLWSQSHPSLSASLCMSFTANVLNKLTEPDIGSVLSNSPTLFRVQDVSRLACPFRMHGCPPRDAGELIQYRLVRAPGGPRRPLERLWRGCCYLSACRCSGWRGAVVAGKLQRRGRQLRPSRTPSIANACGSPLLAVTASPTMQG